MQFMCVCAGQYFLKQFCNIEVSIGNKTQVLYYFLKEDIFNYLIFAVSSPEWY